jgi:putative ATP-dependent endonuclease of OLD family
MTPGWLIRRRQDRKKRTEPPMKIRYARITHFRGFNQLELRPRDNVFVVGQPGAGRSDLVEALWRVLSSDSTRFPLSEDLDFHKRDLSKRIEVEVVLGELGPEIEQAFLDRLEYWDTAKGTLLEDIGLPDEEGPHSDGSLERVLRLCYRAIWDYDQQQARHWVDFPKFSDPDADDYRRVPRDLRGELPVALVNTTGAALSFSARSDLRRLVDADQQTDFSAALDQMMDGIENLAAKLVQSMDLAAALDRILEPLRVPLGIGTKAANEIIRFTPEGGSLAGILRGLQATVKLREELGFLPLARHGSTLTGLFQTARALAGSDPKGAVILVDDFGEGLDLDAALHLASILRQRAGQVWLSTRMGALGQCFRPEELLRLTVTSDGARAAHSGQPPTSKAERLAARHLHLQILPAISAKSVVIVEGPHDRAALATAAMKLHAEEGVPLLAAQRIALLDAGAADQSGGHTAIPRLAELARRLGFHVIAVIDWDRDVVIAQQCLADTLAHAQVVIRWPQGCAIERAILGGLDDAVIRPVIQDVGHALAVTPDFDPAALSGDDLVKRTVKFLKSSGGLHGAFVEALPNGVQSVLLRKCLDEIRGAITKSGHVQL